MNKNTEKLNKYFAVNSVKVSEESVSLGKKRIASYKVSDKELSEKVYFWDPVIRRFIKTGY